MNIKLSFCLILKQFAMKFVLCSCAYISDKNIDKIVQG